MRIVIVGAGKIGSALTQQLAADHRVTVIDQNAQLIENIINVYDVMGICGNGASYEIQQEAEVGKAELLCGCEIAVFQGTRALCHKGDNAHFLRIYGEKPVRLSQIHAFQHKTSYLVMHISPR